MEEEKLEKYKGNYISRFMNFDKEDTDLVEFTKTIVPFSYMIIFGGGGTLIGYKLAEYAGTRDLGEYLGVTGGLYFGLRVAAELFYRIHKPKTLRARAERKIADKKKIEKAQGQLSLEQISQDGQVSLQHEEGNLSITKKE